MNPTSLPSPSAAAAAAAAAHRRVNPRLPRGTRRRRSTPGRAAAPNARRARNAAAELVPSLAPSPGDSHATRGAKRRDSGVRARRTNRRSPSHSGTTTSGTTTSGTTTSGTNFSGTTTTAAADVWKRRGLAAGYYSGSVRFVRIVSRD